MGTNNKNSLNFYTLVIKFKPTYHIFKHVIQSCLCISIRTWSHLILNKPLLTVTVTINSPSTNNVQMIKKPTNLSANIFQSFPDKELNKTNSNTANIDNFICSKLYFQSKSLYLLEMSKKYKI